MSNEIETVGASKPAEGTWQWAFSLYRLGNDVERAGDKLAFMWGSDGHDYVSTLNRDDFEATDWRIADPPQEAK